MDKIIKYAFHLYITPSCYMKSILQSSLFRSTEIILKIAIGLILTPYLIHHLGELDYGLWILVLSILGWFSFSDLGFSAAIQRELSFAINSKDNHRVKQVYSCSIILFTVLGGMATLGVFFIGVFPQILGIPEDKLITASNIITILCLKIFIDFMLYSFHGVFVGHIRYDIDANIETASLLLKTLLIFMSIDPLGLYGVVFSTIIADFLKAFLKVYYANKLQDGLSFSWKLVTWAEIKNLFSYSKHVIASTIARTIHLKSDPVIISHIIDVSTIAIYSIADKLVKMLESLVTAIVDVFQPIFFKHVDNDTEIEKMFYFTFSINCFFSSIFFIPLSILSGDFIVLWVGEKFSSASMLVFILIFAFMSKVISRPVSYILLARAQHKLMSLVNLSGAILNITLSVILGKAYGLVGIVAATSISFILIDVFLYLAMLKFYTQIKVLKIFFNFLIFVLLYFLMNYFSHFFIINLNINPWLLLMMNATLVFVINLFISWFLLLDRKTQTKIIFALKNILLRKKRAS